MQETLTGPSSQTAEGSRHRDPLGRVRSLLWHRDEFRIYRYRLAEWPAARAEGRPVVSRDRTADLELYMPSGPWWLPKRKFLKTAAERLAAGEHVYTVTAGRRLLHYAWLADARELMSVQEVDQTFHFAIPGAVLYDAYTMPDARGRGHQAASMIARLRDARELAGARWAYVGCLAANTWSRKVIEKSGFAYYTSLHRMQALGVASLRWQATARV